MNGDQIGTIVGVAFGCAWGIAGSVQLPGVWRVIGIFSSFVISAILVVLIHDETSAVAGQFNGAIYGVAVTLEVLAIVAASMVLSRTNRRTLIPPSVAVIVGLHFIGLWLATHNLVFVWLAAALCAVGLIASLTRAPARLPVAGLGSALALWGSAATTLVKL